MKSSWRKLVNMLGVTLSMMVLTGCETEAEEAKSTDSQESTPETNSSATLNAVPILSNTPPVTNVVASATTNPPLVSTNPAIGTNLVTDPQIAGVNAIPPTLPTHLNLTLGAQEIAKLAQSGVSETVILLYIEKAREPFNLDAADIVYLNDIGISATVITAMLNHDGAAPELHQLVTNNNEIATAPVQPANDVAQPAPAQLAASQYEVSSNYVANASPVPVQEAHAAQQQVIVQQPVVVEQPAVAYSYFYSSLAPYGGWVFVADYGWCWRPTIAVTHRGWRPYAHGGRWLNSDAGWYWHSDYSWGWAPFHYGRWYCSPRVGWVWTPGYTWGPSWVTWRRGGDYCGWAPLPPRCDVVPGIGFSYWNRNVGFNFSFGLGYEHYTFVPTRHFAGRRVTDHVVPTERTSNIYKDSTVVNNYIVGNNNTIVNNGIGTDYVKAHTRSEIPKVTIREQSGPGRSVPGRMEKAGNDLVVYRPTPPPARAEQALRETRERVRPSAAGPSVTSGFASDGSAPSDSRPGVEPRRGSPTASPRGEVARPSIASRNEVPLPAYATPAPIRPEPKRTIASTVRPSRSSAERLGVTPGTVPTATGRPGGVRPAVNSPTARPDLSAGNFGGAATPATRPSINAPARSEVTRPSVGADNASSSASSPAPAASPNVARPNSSTISQPATPRPNYPARSPESASPRFEARNNASPVSPMQSANPGVRPLSRQYVNPAPQSGNGSSAIPRMTPQPNVSAAPQVVRPSAPIQQVAPTPSVSSPVRSLPPVSRSESYGSSRPAVAPIQRLPSGSASATPSAPSISAPQQRSVPSAPATRSEPLRPSASAPSSGGGRNSAASAPAPARPNTSAPAQSGGARPDGRGRVEVGR